MSTESHLAQLRRDRRLSQAVLADRCGVSRAEISAIETGRVVPSVSVALRLAAALGEAVEEVFAPCSRTAPPAFAWSPLVPGDARVWRAAIAGRVLLYPAEGTAAGQLPHDATVTGGRLQPRSAASPPERTLVLAGCDPLVGLLVRELAASHRIRVIPLIRSSSEALQLLGRGLVHAAGLHLTDDAGRPANERIVRAVLGPGYRLIRQVRWEAGIALAPGRRERSVPALLRARVRWVNREEGSGARRTLDALLASRRTPEGYEYVVRDHRAVAATVSSGWAEAGVCVRPAAAEARLPFIPLHEERYELCVRAGDADDPRVSALVATLQGRPYRQQVGDVPGCTAADTGDVCSVS